MCVSAADMSILGANTGTGRQNSIAGKVWTRSSDQLAVLGLSVSFGLGLKPPAKQEIVCPRNFDHSVSELSAVHEEAVELPVAPNR